MRRPVARPFEGEPVKLPVDAQKVIKARFDAARKPILGPDSILVLDARTREGRLANRVVLWNVSQIGLGIMQSGLKSKTLPGQIAEMLTEAIRIVPAGMLLIKDPSRRDGAEIFWIASMTGRMDDILVVKGRELFQLDKLVARELRLKRWNLLPVVGGGAISFNGDEYLARPALTMSSNLAGEIHTDARRPWGEGIIYFQMNHHSRMPSAESIRRLLTPKFGGRIQSIHIDGMGFTSVSREGIEIKAWRPVDSPDPERLEWVKRRAVENVIESQSDCGSGFTIPRRVINAFFREWDRLFRRERIEGEVVRQIPIVDEHENPIELI
jgi:hypothetical protein